MPENNAMTAYKLDLIRRYWEYQSSHFSDWQKYLERPCEHSGRPPVFLKDQAWRNVILNSYENQVEKNKLLSLIQDGERHQWFRSMNSSQALAQSVLGNLSIHDAFHCLTD